MRRSFHLQNLLIYTQFSKSSFVWIPSALGNWDEQKKEKWEQGVSKQNWMSRMQCTNLCLPLCEPMFGGRAVSWVRSALAPFKHRSKVTMVNAAHPALRNKITPTLCSISVRNEFYRQRTLPRFPFKGSHFNFNRTFVFFQRNSRRYNSLTCSFLLFCTVNRPVPVLFIYRNWS